MNTGPGSHSLRFQFTRPVRSLINTSVAVFQKHPFLVKTLSSGVGFAIGDGITQLLTRDSEKEAYDWTRTIKMGSAGLAIAGPLGYLFLIWMEGNLMVHNPHTWVYSYSLDIHSLHIVLLKTCMPVCRFSANTATIANNSTPFFNFQYPQSVGNNDKGHTGSSPRRYTLASSFSHLSWTL